MLVHHTECAHSPPLVCAVDACRGCERPDGPWPVPASRTEILSRPAGQELPARDGTRPAYVAKDGTPRNIPIAFTCNGAQVVSCTTKNAPKLPSLRRKPGPAPVINPPVRPAAG